MKSNFIIILFEKNEWIRRLFKFYLSVVGELWFFDFYFKFINF